MMLPTFKALKRLGGEAKRKEVIELAIKISDLTESEKEIKQHDNDTQTLAENDIAWARWKLYSAGYLTSPRRGVWALSTKGREISVDEFDADRVMKLSQSNYNERETVPGKKSIPQDEVWKEDLLNKIKKMSPQRFEELSGEILTKMGVDDVVVTQYVGDGGIDGTGVITIDNLLSFGVAFQSKRYTNPITSEQMRIFRGSMDNNYDRGIYITTSSFNKGAIETAKNGSTIVTLIDGEMLVDLLEKYQMGVKTETVIKTEIDDSFFEE
ncbi:Mrr restriction system protein [Pediococcus argentinicus]|uniref:Mrr restriction system protein n=2 Tax=Pediococcus argentinicus TaxID=480391 RepID=A0A0R2NCP2_9LACO|nr:Mrr restriction system protein [Pediococcus argentinicus]